MKQITIDCSTIENKDQLHDAFSRALCFPAHYGRNLDALHDCLTEIAEPNSGLITNVGIDHRQGFGSFEGVVRTKREMYDYLLTTPHRTIFLNADNHYLRTISEGLNPVTYGQSEELDICLGIKLTN